MEIVFRLENQIISMAERKIIAAKSKNYIRARFELLSDDWTAPITAIFGGYTVVLDENNSCIVPWEALEHPGILHVSAFCGDLHTATEERIHISETGYTAGQTPSPPTPDVYAQLAEMVQSAINQVNTAGDDVKMSEQAAKDAAARAAESAAAASESSITAIQNAETSTANAALTAQIAEETAAILTAVTEKNQEAATSANNASVSANLADTSARSAAQSALEAQEAASSVPQIDDTQPSPVNPWSGAKTSQEISQLSDQIASLEILPEVSSEDNGKTLAVMNGKWGLVDPSIGDFADVQKIVQSGAMTQYFSVGDQLSPVWVDADGKSYRAPFDIVQLNHACELESGAAITGMMIQQHYANVRACPFDAQEALYDADEELPAGTYHFTVAGHPSADENGKVLQFTLAQPIPAGGQLVCADTQGYNQALNGQMINTYSSPTSFTAIESVMLSEGSGGVDLGVTDGKGLLNHLCRAYRGSGRWKTSMLRQYLNSGKPAGQWWSKQDKWDRASSFINACPGYLDGFGGDFLATIKPIKIQTARDRVLSDAGIDITFDRFFPLSLEQMNITPQAAVSEGAALDYWKEIAKHEDVAAFSRYGTYPCLTTHSVNNKTVARTCVLRSPSISNVYTCWRLMASGYISDAGHALYSDQYCTPACVIG